MAAEDILVHVGADVGDLAQGMGQANKAIDSFEKSSSSANAAFKGGLVGGLIGSLNPIGLVTQGIGQLGNFMMSAVDAAKEEEVGIQRLNQALQNNVGAWDPAALDTYISSQEKLAFADDQLRDSLGFLVGQTGNLAEAQMLQATAMDLARAKGISLEAATKAVGKVDQESIGILKKLGIEVTENMTKQEALAAIQASTAGQAQAYANTAAGAQERLGNIMGNIMEDVGSFLLPMLTTALQGAVTAFEGLSTAVGPAMAFLGQLASTIGTALQPAIDTFLGVWNGFIAIIQPQIENVTGFVNGIVTAFQTFFGTIGGGGDVMGALGTLFTDLGTNIGTFITNTITWLGEAIPQITAQLGLWAEAFWKWIQDSAIPGLMTALQGLGEAIWGWITGGGLQGLISNLVTWGGAILNFIAKDVLPFIGQKLLDLGTFIWNWITGGGLTSLISNLVTWGGAFLNFIAKDVLPFIGQKLGELATFLWNWITNDALPTIITKLGEWGSAFLNWVTKDVLPTIGTKLGEIATAIWNWITQTAKDFVTNVKELATSFWTWITDTVTNIPTKLAEIATAIWTWITDTAKDALTKAAAMGKNIIDGILNGLKNAAGAIWDWLTGLLGGMVQGVKDFFGIKSPSKLMAEEVGKPIAEGIGVGFAKAWGKVEGGIMGDVAGITGGRMGGITVPVRGSIASGAVLGGGQGAGITVVVDGYNVPYTTRQARRQSQTLQSRALMTGAV
jgi:phage-related protein